MLAFTGGEDSDTLAQRGPTLCSSIGLDGFARAINPLHENIKLGGRKMNGSNNSTDSVSGEYHPDTQTYHIYHDWEQSPSISTTVSLGVATLDGVRPEDIEPLHHVIDPDALDALYQSVSEDPSVWHDCVSFPWEGRDVTVYADGEIVISVPVECSRGVMPRDMSRFPLHVVKRLLARGQEVFQRVIGS